MFTCILSYVSLIRCAPFEGDWLLIGFRYPCMILLTSFYGCLFSTIFILDIFAYSFFLFYVDCNIFLIANSLWQICAFICIIINFIFTGWCTFNPSFIITSPSFFAWFYIFCGTLVNSFGKRFFDNIIFALLNCLFLTRMSEIRKGLNA